MLQPTNRLTLIDAMRPPAGFQLEAAMAVSFTLDLRALLAAPAAFALGRPDLAGDDGHHEPIELLHALRTNSEKLTVFSQAGEIALPPSRRVFAFLEGTVVPVRAPRGGIVHPKVWVLRYESNNDGQLEQRLRVLIASRNLTFDASWDTVIRLDESTSGGGANLEPVGHLFEGLISSATTHVQRNHRDRVASLASALREAAFDRPDGVDDIHVHVLGLTPTPSPLPTAADRSLVISPFVSEDFFTRACEAPVHELVSRVESLDELGEQAVASIPGVYVFDDGSTPEVESNEQLSPRDPGRPLAGLHAKVFAFEQDDRARLYLGSANATGAAFNSNVEILIEFTGPVETLGIDRLLEGTGDEPGLRSLFNTYHRYETSDESEGPADLDAVRAQIAQLPIEGSVEQSVNGWSVTYRSVEPLPKLAGADVHCWPLASAGNRRRIQPAEPLEARFETSLETISGFLAFELSKPDGAMSQFVVPVPLRGLPEHRDRHLLKALVGNAERFLRYLLALLDEDSAQMELLEAVDRVGDDSVGGNGAANLPVLEQLLRTMRRDPSKLAGLHPLVVDLGADDALPPGFSELWATIHDVVST